MPTTPSESRSLPLSDRLYEVVDGEIRDRPELWASQGERASFLAGCIVRSGETDRAGRILLHMLYLLDARTDLQRRPTLSFLSRERWPLNRPAPRTDAWAIAPDLAVEFVAETETAGDLLRKVEEYFQAGVRKVWVFYTEIEKFYIYQSPSKVTILTRSDTLDGSDIIPGFRIPLADLFPDRLKARTGPAQSQS